MARVSKKSGKSKKRIQGRSASMKGKESKVKKLRKLARSRKRR